MSPQFAVTVDRVDGLLTIRPTGELDLATAGELAAVIDRECPGSSDMVIDLSGLTFLDCGGVRVLLDADARAKSRGCAFRLVPGPRSVQRVLGLAGLEDQLPFATRT